MKAHQLLCCGVSMVCLTVAFGEERLLNDDQLDVITAGYTDVNHAPGGVIVANGSSATVDQTALVSIASGAQDGARILNLVNSADSLVAQGLNVWDGNFTGDGDLEVESEVEQSNTVLQSNATRSASLEQYGRGANTLETSSISERTMTNDQLDLMSDVMVDTSAMILGQSLHMGVGVGVAGRVDIELGAAMIDVFIRTVLGTLTLDVTFPSISIDSVGSVCVTQLGECKGKATDRSTYMTDTMLGEEHRHEIRGPFSIDSAEAEYIVVDDSELNVTSSNSIMLAENSQANLAALNAVNAVGSMVANAVNISRTQMQTAQAARSQHLVQRNVVIQGH